MRTRFESIGAYTPTAVRSTQEVLAELAMSRTPDLQRLTGVGNRHVYDSDPEHYESSFELALRAIDDCLQHSEYRAAELDVIISASITHFSAPGIISGAPSFALMLRNEIGAANAMYFDVSNACAGMLTGVMLLDRMIKAGVVRNGLVVSGEQITPIAETAAREMTQPIDPQFAALTVGDAGAAIVVDDRGDDDDEIHYIDLMTIAGGAEYCMGMPSDKTAGPAMYTDSRSLASELHFSQFITRWADFLAETERTWDGEKFDYWIHHQFSLRSIEQICRLAERRLGTTMPPALNVLEEYGNTASTSHFLVLHECLAQQRIPKGSKVALMPFASGVVSGMLAATISRLEA